MNALNFLKPRFPTHEEQEQALVRLAISAMLLAYAGLLLPNGRYGGKQMVFLAAGYLAFATAIYALTRLSAAVNGARRMLSAVVDAGVITAWLVFAGNGGAESVGIYLFLIFSYGCRFGRIYFHCLSWQVWRGSCWSSNLCHGGNTNRWPSLAG
jgi:hypothetical protein